MGVLSEKYVMSLLKEYAKSRYGKGFKVANDDPSSNDDKLGIKLVLGQIKYAFCEAVEKVIHSFRGEYVYTQITKSDNKGIHAVISVDEEELRRESLHYMNKKTKKIGRGEGVDDILALFTHGYTISGKRPFGFWVRAGGKSMNRIGALMHRDPNPFLSQFVDEMNAEYGKICTVTLNDRYVRG